MTFASFGALEVTVATDAAQEMMPVNDTPGPLRVAFVDDVTCKAMLSANF